MTYTTCCQNITIQSLTKEQETCSLPPLPLPLPLSEKDCLNYSRKKLERSSGDKSSATFSNEEDEGDKVCINIQLLNEGSEFGGALQQRVADQLKAANNCIHELLQDFF